MCEGAIRVDTLPSSHFILATTLQGRWYYNFYFYRRGNLIPDRVNVIQGHTQLKGRTAKFCVRINFLSTYTTRKCIAQ